MYSIQLNFGIIIISCCIEYVIRGTVVLNVSVFILKFGEIVNEDETVRTAIHV